MTKRESELIPRKVINKIESILDPVDPESADAAIRYLIDELNDLFRDLNEMRSATEDDAREVLSRHEMRVLRKLQELFPDQPSRVEGSFGLMIDVIEDHFMRLKGRMYL